METTQNNRLIAEFMELPTEIFSSGRLNYGINEAWYELEELSFNIDWNWLMKVIDKIESLQATIRLTSNFNPFHNQNYHQVTIEIAEGKLSESKKTFSGDGFIYKHHSNSGLNRIDCYYESIIEFINWYNENK